LEGAEESREMITESQRKVVLEDKVERLDRDVTDLRRCIEALNALVGEGRLYQMKSAVLSKNLQTSDNP
jgi:ubiquinone biosynthesis protein UbiJ